MNEPNGVTENDAGTTEPKPGSMHPAGSATCCLCNWTNINLLNLGEPGEPRWTCHGCCKRMLDALERLRDGDFTGTSINRNSSAMMLIEEALSPNDQAQRPARIIPMSYHMEQSGHPDGPAHG